MYCGDETGAFLGDIGTTSSKFGYGGEDCPKLVVPSHLSHNYQSFPSSTTKPSQDIIPIYHQPTSSINPLENINDGIISSFDAWEHMWSNVFHTLSISKNNEGKCLHPLLAIDSGNTHHCSQYDKGVYKKQRETMIEIMFEKFGTPAAFIAPAPMVQAFSMGRQTALVMDIGGGGSRATPVVDGLLLKQSQRRNGMGGDWLSSMQLKLLQQSDIKAQPRYSLVLAEHYNNFAMRELMYELKTNHHVKLSYYGANAMELDDEIPTYTLPDGTSIDFGCKHGKQLMHLPDLLFSSNSFQECDITPPEAKSDLPKTLLPNAPLVELIHTSISSTDPDIRKELINNIILVGSSSLFANLDKRLSFDLFHAHSNATYNKYKVIASKNSIERKFASWIGGSVLSSLGSFQQLWLGKTEYEEYGVLLSCNRFP